MKVWSEQELKEANELEKKSLEHYDKMTPETSWKELGAAILLVFIVIGLLWLFTEKI
jgi:hypothetical protein